MPILNPDHYDYKKCDLHGEDFTNRELAGADFEEAHLDGAVFDGADLRHANLRFTSLRDAHFEDTNLRDADLFGADIDGAHFIRCLLRDDTFLRARIDSTPIIEESIIKPKFDEERERGEAPTPPWKRQRHIMLAPRQKSTITQAIEQPKKKFGLF